MNDFNHFEIVYIEQLAISGSWILTKSILLQYVYNVFFFKF